MKAAGSSTAGYTSTTTPAPGKPSSWTREEITTLYVVLAIVAVVVIFLIFAWALLGRRSHRDRTQVEEEGDHRLATPRTIVNAPAPPAGESEPGSDAAPVPDGGGEDADGSGKPPEA